MNIKLRIMLRAVQIRMKNGEKPESILRSYPRLTDEEKEILRNAV